MARGSVAYLVGMKPHSEILTAKSTVKNITQAKSISLKTGKISGAQITKPGQRTASLSQTGNGQFFG
jgi:hypothetical protein